MYWTTICSIRKEIVRIVFVVAQSATAKLTFPRQNLLFHGKTYFSMKTYFLTKSYFLTAKLTFPRKLTFLAITYLAAKLIFSRQNLLGKTYFLLQNLLFPAKLTFPRQNLLFHGKLTFSRQNLLSHGKTYFRLPALPAIKDPGIFIALFQQAEEEDFV